MVERLQARCRELAIEPPTAERVERIARAALRARQERFHADIIVTPVNLPPHDRPISLNSRPSPPIKFATQRVARATEPAARFGQWRWHPAFRMPTTKSEHWPRVRHRFVLTPMVVLSTLAARSNANGRLPSCCRAGLVVTVKRLLKRVVGILKLKPLPIRGEPACRSDHLLCRSFNVSPGTDLHWPGDSHYRHTAGQRYVRGGLGMRSGRSSFPNHSKAHYWMLPFTIPEKSKLGVLPYPHPHTTP